MRRSEQNTSFHSSKGRLDVTIRLWCSYIHILVCFVYLAVILDVYSRKVIGHALSRNIDTNLTLNALRMAINKRQPAQGCIHHSDQGIQYASADYVKELEFYGFKISMSRRGNPYDNAYAKSFMKTLKSEEVQLWEYRTMEDVQKEFLISLKIYIIRKDCIHLWAIVLHVSLRRC